MSQTDTPLAQSADGAAPRRVYKTNPNRTRRLAVARRAAEQRVEGKTKEGPEGKTKEGPEIVSSVPLAIRSSPLVPTEHITVTVRNISPDKALLPEKARVWIDPADKRYEATITIPPDYPNRSFHMARIIQGLTDQLDVKHLYPVESGIRYLSHVSRGMIVTHGRNHYIYQGIIHLPINPHVPAGTVFTAAVDNVNGTHAVTVLSDKLVTDAKLSCVPFNRRCYLMHVLPGEIFEATYRVATTDNFSVRESTHFAIPNPNVLVVGTQLGTDPKEVLERVMGDWTKRILVPVNNPFAKLIAESGFLPFDEEQKRGELSKEARQIVTDLATELMSLFKAIIGACPALPR